MQTKNLYIVAGCNGAGKTTASYTILPEIIDCQEFVNADEIAKGISPFRPDRVSIEAGRIMLKRIDELLFKNETFAFETTLATRSYKNKILEAQAADYKVTLLFFWLSDMNLAKERVKLRVMEGGHNIEPNIIERRYLRGIINLFDIYLPIVDNAFILDNSLGETNLIAMKSNDQVLKIIDIDIYKKLKIYYDSH